MQTTDFLSKLFPWIRKKKEKIFGHCQFRYNKWLYGNVVSMMLPLVSVKGPTQIMAIRMVERHDIMIKLGQTEILILCSENISKRSQALVQGQRNCPPRLPSPTLHKAMSNLLWIQYWFCSESSLDCSPLTVPCHLHRQGSMAEIPSFRGLKATLQEESYLYSFSSFKDLCLIFCACKPSTDTTG